MSRDELCPKCGAYWACGCRLDEVVLTSRRLAELAPAADPGCAHDWSEAVGVDVSEDYAAEGGVFICRLCGAYRVAQAGA